MTKPLAAFALVALGALAFGSGCAAADQTSGGVSEDLLTGDDSNATAAS